LQIVCRHWLQLKELHSESCNCVEVEQGQTRNREPSIGSRREIAGYLRYCAIRAGGAILVYGDDLETVVGHMLPGRGFVAGALP